MYTYTSWFNQLFNSVAAYSTGNGQPTTDQYWLTEIPGIIDYAEQRLYRELDLLATRITDQSATLTANQRTFSLPTFYGNFLVVEEMNVITPYNATFSSGSRVALVPASKQFIDWSWPSAAVGNTVPEWYAPLDNATMLLGPAPDQAYPMEVIGTQRPTPLSSANAITILTTMLPDLWMAATMIKASGFMRNFGSQADNPAMSVSWQGQYDLLFKSADAEEARKMYRSMAWTSEQQKMVTIPPRM
jgi:hypothetical protein